MTRRGGPIAGQLDLLLDWEPEEIVQRYDDQQVRAATLHGKIAKAVAETLRECSKDRTEVAKAMSAFLGVKVTLNMVNAYAAQSRPDQAISFERVIALVHATGDVRLLQLAAGLFEHSVVHDKYLPWVQVGQISSAKDGLDEQLRLARRQAKKAMRR